jgi:hypothetical protein
MGFIDRNSEEGKHKLKMEILEKLKKQQQNEQRRNNVISHSRDH